MAKRLKGGRKQKKRQAVPAGYVQIVPRSPVWLRMEPLMDSVDPEYFIRVFRECWKKLPLGPKRRILDYERKYSTGFSIEILPQSFLGSLFGAAKFNGVVQFSSSLVDLWPERRLRLTIFHELAHIFDHANITHGLSGREAGEALLAANDSETEEAREARVNGIVKSWGFQNRPVFKHTKRDGKRIGRNLSNLKAK